MKVNFYLDKPYNNEIKPDVIKKELAKIGNNKKNLPNKFFNPNPTSLYLFFSPDKSCRIKYRTNYKILAKNWDFDKEKLKSTTTGSLEFNLELSNLETTCLKEARIKKEKNQYLSKNDYKIIIQECIDRDNAVNNEISVFQLASKFLSYKSSFVKEGTLKEYRTVFKGLEEFEGKTGSRLILRELDNIFFDKFEVFLSRKPNSRDSSKKGLLNDTIHKYISTLKVFLKWCNDNHLVHPDVFKTQKTNFKKRAYNEVVSLNENEIELFKNLDLSNNPRLEKTRDIFLLLLWTGQRYSDIIEFDKSTIRNNTWDFISNKVKKRIT